MASRFSGLRLITSLRFWRSLLLRGLVPLVALPIDLLLAQAGGTTPVQPPRATLLEADRAASRAVHRSGMASGLAGALADDALLLYEGAPIVAGRDRALRVLAAQPALANLRMQWLPLVVTVSADGSLGVTYGTTVISNGVMPPDSGLAFGRYVSVWQPTPEGGWKIVAHLQTGLADPAAVVIPELPGAASGVDPMSPTTGAASAFAQADAEFARLAADSGAPAAFAAFAAPDATIFAATGEILIGPATIRARMLEARSARSLWSWQPRFAAGAAGGDLGFTVGEAVIRSQSPTGVAATYYSKYLTVWRRQPDGRIRFIVDAGNARPER